MGILWGRQAPWHLGRLQLGSPPPILTAERSENFRALWGRRAAFIPAASPPRKHLWLFSSPAQCVTPHPCSAPTQPFSGTLFLPPSPTPFPYQMPRSPALKNASSSLGSLKMSPSSLGSLCPHAASDLRDSRLTVSQAICRISPP